MRLRLLVLLALTCALALAGAASAAAGGATVLHFAVTYPGDVAHCTGNRITQDNGQTFIKDVETCIVSADFNPFAPGTYDVNSPETGGWCSDVDGAIFDLSTCNPAISGHVTVTANSDGTFTWDIVAYYAQP